MYTKLLSDIDEFLQLTGMTEYRFGIRAASNGRLLERLRAGKRVWPETEAKVRGFMIAERQRRAEKQGQAA